MEQAFEAESAKIVCVEQLKGSIMPVPEAYDHD